MTSRAPRRSAAHAAPRIIWEDRWLLDAFRRLGHPAIERLATVKTDTAWEALIAAGADAEQVFETACALSRCGPADLTSTSPDLATALDPAIARRFAVVPLRWRAGQLEVATCNPLRPGLEEDLAFAAGARVALGVAPPDAIARAQDVVYGRLVPEITAAPPTGPRLQWVQPPGRAIVSAAPTRGAAVRILDDVVIDALDEGASDIHFEPAEQGLLVRFRVDGVLRDIVMLADELAPHLISRIKVMAGLDIADRRRPQDGRASMRFDGRAVDLRVSTLPLGRDAEKAVIRILDAAGTLTTFPALGFSQGESHRLGKLLRGTEGLVLVTGPTGSGKTTTLYTALRTAQDEETNVVTVEDPIEYRLERVNQVQVHDRSGLTFAAALRSILRQDPDVVLVGEVRDAETAGIAVKAALTGHVVLSTLHTNDAPSAVTRLMDMGTDRVALGSALKGVVAQRLVRTLCAACARPVTLDQLPAEQQRLLSGRDASGLRQAVGCEACRHSGYRGRTIVAEVLTMGPDLQRAVARGADGPEIAGLAREAGMRTLWESGLAKVEAGITTLHELIDNVGRPPEGEAGAEDAGGQQDVDALLAQLLPSFDGADPAAADAASADAGPAAAHAPPVAGGRILVVDDDPAARRATRGILEQAGHVVIESADGETGLAYARKLRPDLVLSEIALPGLDGLGLLQAVRGELGVPVVFHTRERDEALRAWARELGAREIVAKDASPVAAVAAALRPA